MLASVGGPGGTPNDGVGSMDIDAWLRSLDLERYARAFREHAVDAPILAALTSDDLRDIGVRAVGDRRRILAAAAALSAEPFEASASPSPLPVGGERRRLSVMFVDLVGSTGLAAALDPEEMRDVLRAYQDAVAGCVARLDGHIAKFMGDGVLCYFGWPRSHENEAERSVQAAMDVRDAVQRLPDPRGGRLCCRIGIASGLVVVGDRLGDGDAREEAVTGEAPNVAARLQGLAQPGQILVAEEIRRLAGGSHSLRKLGQRRARGLERPITVYAVTGTMTRTSRFEGRHPGRVAPVLGREHELGLLQASWRAATAGAAQCILVEGEAGVGKSRIAHAFLGAIAAEPHVVVTYQCSPFHVDSSLWPVVQQLRLAAGLAESDGEAAQLERLHTLLGRAVDVVDGPVQLLAPLLGLPPSGTDGDGDLVGPFARRRAVLRALVEQLCGLARRQPVVVLIEDAHWIDPTTLELVELAREASAGLPVLFLVTARTGQAPALVDAGNEPLTRVVLGRLDASRIERLVRRAAGSRQLSSETVDAIVERADGIALFAEEITAAVLAGDGLSVPASLHDGLMARLDQVPDARAVAQTAAVVGRAFDRATLAALSDARAEVIDEALASLQRAGIIVKRRLGVGSTFAFRHALLRDAAYESLLLQRRRALHAALAERLVAQNDAEPELIAHHFASAALPWRALHYGALAAAQSVARSANREAVAQARTALNLLATLPENKERDGYELALLMSQGTAVINIEGWATATAEPIYRRAARLAASLDRPEAEFSATWNLWLTRQQQADVVPAQRLLRRTRALAGRLGTDEATLQAEHAAWSTKIQTAPLAEVEGHLSAGLDLYDAARHGRSWIRFGGHDPGVCCHGHSAWVAWLEGHPNRAMRHVAEGIAIAERIDHPYSILVSRFYRCTALLLRREAAPLCDDAEATLAFAVRHGFRHHAAIMKVIKGWAAVAAGSVAEGLETAERGLAEIDALSIRLRRPWYACLCAEAFVMAGRSVDAAPHVREAQALARASGDVRWRPELLRLQAAIVRDDGPEATRLLRAAVADAERQGAWSLALRAARALATVRAEAGHRGEAAALLRRACGAVGEGHDGADLRDSMALLDALR